MSVTDNRIKLTQEFLGARLEQCLLDCSDELTKRTKKGETVQFHILKESQFQEVIDRMNESVHEYLSADFWTDKSIH